jgi:hypothetical protein
MQAGISLYACNYLDLPSEIMARTQGTSLGCGLSTWCFKSDFRGCRMNPTLHQIALRSRSRGSARCLLLALVLKADESGSCIENNAVLGKLAGMARNHVCRAARRLVELGELVVEPMAGANRLNRYLLTCYALEQPVSHGGAQDQSVLTPAPSPAPAEDSLEAIHRLRAQAWEAFDMNGRSWFCASDEEREGFAASEISRRLLESVSELAAAAGVRVAPTGDIEEPGS